MNPFFDFIRKAKFGLFLSLLVALAWIPNLAQAQGITLQGVMTQTQSQAPAPIGLSVQGWQQSSSIGQGYNTGGDGNGKVETLADGFFRIGADSYLTGNANAGCTANCSDTQAKLWIIGEQITGARSTNQGVGNGVISSVAGTNGVFNASLRTSWTFAPAPAPQP